MLPARRSVIVELIAGLSLGALLKRRYVLVFIEHGTRRMHLGGVTANPVGELRPAQRTGGPARPRHSSGEALTWRDEPVTLRWVLMHLIEETARTTVASAFSGRWPTVHMPVNGVDRPHLESACHARGGQLFRGGGCQGRYDK